VFEILVELVFIVLLAPRPSGITARGKNKQKKKHATVIFPPTAVTTAHTRAAKLMVLGYEKELFGCGLQLWFLFCCIKNNRKKPESYFC